MDLAKIDTLIEQAGQRLEAAIRDQSPVGAREWGEAIAMLQHIRRTAEEYLSV